MTHIKFDSSALKQFVHENNELAEMQAMVNCQLLMMNYLNGTGVLAPTSVIWLHFTNPEYDIKRRICLL